MFGSPFLDLPRRFSSSITFKKNSFARSILNQLPKPPTPNSNSVTKLHSKKRFQWRASGKSTLLQQNRIHRSQNLLPPPLLPHRPASRLPKKILSPQLKKLKITSIRAKPIRSIYPSANRARSAQHRRQFMKNCDRSTHLRTWDCSDCPDYPSSAALRNCS